MSRGFEGAASRFMDNVKSQVTNAPGLLSLETLKDTEDHKRYVTLSEVRLIVTSAISSNQN
jgi:heme-degrading monooxygenase HmoA